MQDLGISAYHGKNAEEGKLAAFLTAIQTGRVQSGSTLLVESLDRLSRDRVTEALTQFLNIINAGITVVTLMDKAVYSRETINQNPGSLMMSIVCMMRAHEESDTKSKRIGVWIASGPDNITRHNVFIKEEGSVFGMGDRGVGRGYATNPHLINRLQEINPTEDPWKSAHPEVATMLDNRTELPWRTRFVGNLIISKNPKP